LAWDRSGRKPTTRAQSAARATASRRCLDGDLTYEDCARVDKHLLECPDCADLSGELQATVALLGMDLTKKLPSRPVMPQA
jgi:predicted anti-sigma-YlaC factor YlaD